MTNLLLLAVLVPVGALIAGLLARRPKAAIVLWLIVMTCVPAWLSVKFITSLSSLNFAFLLLIPAIWIAADKRVSKVDIMLALFVACATVAYVAAGTPQYAFAMVFVQWLSAYWVGRYLAPAAGQQWTYRAMGITAALIGAWALTEFTFNWHVFVDLVDKSAGWNAIQVRGSFARSEGAFGHSIAMGAFLVLGLPFVIAGKFRPIPRFLMLAVVAGGVLVTFSRGALIGALIALVVSVLFLPTVSLSKNIRTAFIVAIVLASLTVIPMILDLFDAVSYDLDPSTAYRQSLPTFILQDMNAFGPANNMQQAPDGRYFYRSFGSIDNAYLLTVLQFGWVPTAFLVAALLSVILRIVLRRGGPADMAMAAQIWVMGTVALITQYGMALWFVAGMAVAFAGKATAMPDDIELGDPTQDGSRKPPAVRGGRSVLPRHRQYQRVQP